MARKPRLVIPNTPMHIIVRGNNREPVFYQAEDYGFYLDKLKEVCDKYGCNLHAYVLMTNHVHLLLTPDTESGPSKMMQALGRYYVQYFNYTHGRTGTLWEGRFKSSLVDSETYLLVCSRYIELNPTRAENMADHPSEYPWSSYAANAVGNDPRDLITHHELYLRLGKTGEDRQAAYRQLFDQQIESRTVDEITAAGLKDWVLGSPYFKEKISRQIGRSVTPAKRGGDRKSAAFKALLSEH